MRSADAQRRIVHQAVRRTVAFGGDFDAVCDFAFFAQFEQTVDDFVAQRPRIDGVDKDFRHGFESRGIADAPFD